MAEVPGNPSFMAPGLGEHPRGEKRLLRNETGERLDFAQPRFSLAGDSPQSLGRQPDLGGAQAVLTSVWRTCWQQGRSALDVLSQLSECHAAHPGL
jgi:hypothetical protein